MSIIAPITNENALSNISKCFHPVFQVISNDYVLPTEKLVFVAECTRHEIRTREGISVGKMIMQEYDISKKVEYVENSASLIVLTDKRWLRMSLGEFEYSRRIRISDNKSFLGRWLAGEKRKFEWYFIPKELHVYSKKLNAKQYIASQIKVVLLSEIQITGRYEFTLKDGSSTPPSQIHLLTLNLGQLVSYSFKQNDGSRIHQLLQLSSVNNGHIPLVSRDTVNLKNNLSSVDNLEKLKQLKLMLDNGLITEQEYQSKKQELLLRM